MPGFTLVHGKNRPQPFDVFVNADRTSSIIINGMGPTANVDAVIYHHNAKLTGPYVESINDWIEGGAAMCM